MDRENIKTINIEDFKKVKDLLDYCGKDVIVIKSQNLPKDFKENVRLGFFLIIYCFQGESMININNNDYKLNKGNTAILLPGSIIRAVKGNYKHSKENSCVKLFGFSSEFLKNTIQFKKETWDVAYQLYQNPILPSSPKESYKFYLYKEMTRTLFSEPEHPYQKEILKHFSAAIFCEMLSEIRKALPQEEVKRNHDTNRASWIFRKFIELVMQDDGTHRSVAYYADKLCYSPKHLSTIIKRVSGQSPLKVINEHAIQQIKFQLKHSDKSMKELADEFEFTNPSFFGKFVKQHLGISPQQYRNLPKEEKEE